MVGNPHERLNEDKLRILRLVRFFSRFNPGDISGHLDGPTKAAIDEFKDLYSHTGITAERIQMEFILGIKQSLNTASYLKNYASLGLLESVFPGLNVDVSGIDRIGNLKNPRVIFAWLLRSNPRVGQQLNALKYPNELSEPVQFLIDAMQFGPDQALSILKNRDRRLIRPGKKKTSLSPEEMASNEKMARETRQDLADLSKIVGQNLSPEAQARMQHLQTYQPPQISGEELMAQGFSGEAIGKEQQKRALDHYNSSFGSFKPAVQ
jgi:tRNA nucleotidyltransferase/poly(A) polymerase